MKKDASKNEHIYQTGSTKPPKSHEGLIALLLGVVILMGSGVSVLGVMNIQLFSLLSQKYRELNYSNVSVAEPDGNARIASAGEEDGWQVLRISRDADCWQALGMSGEEIGELFRSYNKWPEGLYISRVEKSGVAARADVRCGDILTAVEGIPVSTEEEMQRVMSETGDAQTVKITVVRDGVTIHLTLKRNRD